ncbi:hypothetical protein DYB37_007117 [Aphanomyces astaci]|uniref:Uncharacterized protein n=1 Tax=Aphanomyces astaci TaxID=112090 RepID=A0A418FDQ3_APHAT|nr:hypothetical protein DYB37_007117 [Aphanomyces astaci]
MLEISPNERVTTGNVAEMFKVTILCTRDLVDELPPLPIPEPVKEPSTDAYPKKAHVLSSATTANQNAADGGARMLMSTPHLMLLPSELSRSTTLPPIPEEPESLDVSPNDRVTTGNVAEMFKVTILCTRDLVDELPPLPIPEPVKEPSTDAYPKKAHVLSSATTANQNATDGGARMLMSTPHLMLLPSELISAMELPPLLRTISPRRHRPRPRKYNRVYY